MIPSPKQFGKKILKILFFWVKIFNFPKIPYARGASSHLNKRQSQAHSRYYELTLRQISGYSTRVILCLILFLWKLVFAKSFESLRIIKQVPYPCYVNLQHFLILYYWCGLNFSRKWFGRQEIQCATARGYRGQQSPGWWLSFTVKKIQFALFSNLF